MCKEDLAINNLQWLICHKTKPNPTKPNHIYQLSSIPTGKIYTSFFRKLTTKNLFVHFKSTLPLSAKTNYIRNETKGICSRCSKEKDKITHIAHFINTLRNNDYPTSIIQHLNNNKS